MSIIKLLKQIGIDLSSLSPNEVVVAGNNNLKGSGKIIKDLEIRDKVQAPSTIIDFSDSEGLVSQIVFNAPLTASLEITQILNVQSGETVELIVPHGGHDVSFSPSIASFVQTFTDIGGVYVIRLKKIRSYASGSAVDTFIALDSSGSGTGQVVDTIPPAISNVSVGSITQTSAQLSLTLDKDGTVYWGVFAQGSNPAKTDIINGNGAVANGNVASLGGVENIVANGLTANTGYMFAFFAENTSGYDGAIQSFQNFTTASAADTTPPVFSVTEVVSLTDTGGTFRATINEPGTIYWWVGADGNSPANEAALKAGTGAVDFGSIATNGGVLETDAISGLTINTAYDVYYMATDSATNDTAIQTKIDITTTNVGGGIASTFVWLDAGSTPALPAACRSAGLLDDLLVWTPPGYDGNTAVPFVLFLHGLSPGITQASLQGRSLMDVCINRLRVGGVEPNMIVAAPRNVGTGGWWNDPLLSDIDAIVDWFMGNLAGESQPYNIDNNKIWIVGQSYGGTGVYGYLESAVRRAKLTGAIGIAPTWDKGDVAIPFSEVALAVVHGLSDTNTATSPNKSERIYYWALQGASQPYGPPRFHMFDNMAHSDADWTDFFSGQYYNRDFAIYGYTSEPQTDQEYNSQILYCNPNPYDASGDIIDWLLSKTKGIADTTAPSLSNVSVDNVSSTTARFNVQSNESSYIYWAAYPQGTALQSKADIQAGTGAIDYGTIDTAGGIVENDIISGLTELTDYEVQYWSEDKVTPTSNEGNVSNANTDFTTTATDNSAPVFSNVSVDTITQTTANFNFQVDDSSLPVMVYWVLTTSGAANLTAAQIIAATDGSILDSGNYQETSGSTIRTEGVINISAGTTYKIQYTAVDSASNPNTTTAAQEPFTSASAGAIARALGNFGGPTVPSLGGNWNEARSSVNEVATKAIMSNMIDFDDGSALGWSLWVTGDRWSTNSDNGAGFDPGTQPGAPKELCDAYRGYWWRPSGGFTDIEYRDLPAGTYKVIFFATRDRTQVTRTTVQMNPGGGGPSDTVDAGSGGNLEETIGYTDAINNASFNFTVDGSGVSPTFRFSTPDAYFYINSFELQRLS